MKAVLKLVLALCAGMASYSAAQAQSAPSSSHTGRLLVTGSTTMEPLVKEIARRFSSLHVRVKIEIDASGSANGISAVRDGAADIGMVSRPLDESEKKLFGFPIARDGSGIAVHARNPVRNLKRQQVVGIFSGRIGNWKAVGGQDRAIRTITGGKHGGSTEPFLQAFDMKFAELKTDMELPVNRERVDALLRNVAAVSLLSVGEAERLAESGVPIRLLSVDGVEASRRSIMSGDYAASRPLLLVTPSMPRGLTKAFIDYASSSQVSDLVEKLDFLAYRE
jgi:phosphate transport system substrate-binding protein